MVFVRKEQHLPRCWTEKAPAGSKTDPQLPKAETISNTGSWHLCDVMLIIEFIIIYRVKNDIQQLRESRL